MTRSWKTIGVVGGLGPVASAHFYLRLAALAEGSSDQDHPEVVLISSPKIPSRLEHRASHGPTPLPALAAVCNRLEASGADIIALPSVTTHHYHAELSKLTTIPIVHIADALRGSNGILSRRIGILGTDAALADGTLQSVLTAAETPPPELQTRVQLMVERSKSGEETAASHLFDEIGASSWAKSMDGLLVGCTDISPLNSAAGRPWEDICDIYARYVLEQALVHN